MAALVQIDLLDKNRTWHDYQDYIGKFTLS